MEQICSEASLLSALLHLKSLLFRGYYSILHANCVASAYSLVQGVQNEARGHILQNPRLWF